MAELAADQIHQLNVVRDMFARDRENAWQLASYQRSRRDEVTARIRFALATLNGASAVAVLSILGSLPIGNLVRADALGALLGYAGGVALAGGALYLHEGHLTFLAGQAYVRARSLDSCVSATEAGDDFRAREAAQEAMNRAHEAERNMAAPENGFGIYAAHFSGGCWLAATLALVARAAGFS